MRTDEEGDSSSSYRSTHHELRALERAMPPARHISFHDEPARPPGFRYPRRNASFHAELLRPAVMCSIDCGPSPPQFSADCGGDGCGEMPSFKPSGPLQRSRSYHAKRSRRVSDMDGDVTMEDSVGMDDSSSNGSTYAASMELQQQQVCGDSPPLMLRRRVSIRRSPMSSPSSDSINSMS